MEHKLDVWLFTDKVGTLSFAKGRLQFSYQADWLSAAYAVPLSCSLPLQAGAFSDEVARPFFAGLLPEGQIRQLLSKQFHISSHNDFALLDEIGGECAGAVTFVDHNELPLQGSADEPEVQWLADEELLEVLHELPRRPMLAGSKDIRLSLAGAQHKLPVVFNGKKIGLPRNGSPSTHILKPAINDAPGSVVNESFCLQLASKLNLDAAHTTVYRVGDVDVLLVARYDRIENTQSVLQRIHQEDFCQALAVVPEMKYQNEGGPDLKQCFDLIRAVTRPSAPQILKLLDAVFFNALVGNNDAHAKNFSILYKSAYPVLAPLYDILCTHVYPDFTPKMAMKIGGKYRFDQVLPRHWQQFAAAAGLGEAQTLKRLRQLSVKVPKAAQELQANGSFPYAGAAIVEQIVALIESRCELTLGRLDG